MTRLGLVIPAYRPDVSRLTGYVQALADRLEPTVIRIELDAPRAGVTDEIRAALHDVPVEVNAVDRRRGKGAAITAGFEAMTADVYVFADADGSTPPESLERVIAPVRDGEADLAVGSRRHPDATVESHQGILRRYLGDGYAWLARRVVGGGLYDYQCGAKAISADAWTSVRIHLHEAGFAWDMELVAVANALGHRLREVPVTWADRPGSTVSPVADSPQLLVGLIAARHRANVIRGTQPHRFVESRRRHSPPLVDRVTHDRREPTDGNAGSGVD